MMHRQAGCRSDADLLPGWTRKDDDTIISPTGLPWRYVRRRDVTGLTDDEWQSALLMLRRPSSGWQPCGAEGSFLGNLLHDLGPTSIQTLVFVLRWFADGEEREYITRAVRDKRAHLVLLLPVGAR
jgi:hypothetical protein